MVLSGRQMNKLFSPSHFTSDTYTPLSEARVSISHKAVGKLLLIVGGFLLLAQFSVMFLKYGLGKDYAFGLVPAFQLDGEMNVPSLTSSLLLFITALTAFFTAWALPGAQKHKRAWTIIGVVFVVLSFDETIRLHEQISVLMASIDPADATSHIGWEVPYLAVIGVLGLYMLPWFLALDRGTQIRFAAAGIIYVFGAIGMEHAATIYYAAIGTDRTMDATLTGQVFVTLEEVMEFSGVALFEYSMMRRLRGISLSTGRQERASSSPLSDLLRT